MAHLVPSLEQIDQLPSPLRDGSRALVEVLLSILGDEWTIYIQPFLNGPTPEIFLFSEESGLAIVATRDWNLQYYRVSDECYWDQLTAYDGVEKWHTSTEPCPFREVHYYRRSILQYILPGLQAEFVLKPDQNKFFTTLVYFHHATTAQAMHVARPFMQNDMHKHILVIGGVDLNRDKLGRLFTERNAEQARQFSEMMHSSKMHSQLRRALSYKDQSRSDLYDLQHSLSSKQEELRPNTPGKRRVIGAAGSGKSLLLALKAVDAAINGQKVLITCFNITMTNYLNEMVRELVSIDKRANEACNRRILVRHFHRLFPGVGQLKDKEAIEIGEFDVLLIDEGQDLKANWITKLYEMAPNPNAHVMFVEDERQNIYGVDTKERESIPGIRGRPNVLTGSFRISREIANLANYLIKLSHRQFNSVAIESELPGQSTLDFIPKPIWYDGSPDALLLSLKKEVQRIWLHKGDDGLRQSVILVCTVADGWKVCEVLDDLGLKYDCNFESYAEHERVQNKYAAEGPERCQWRLDDLRRGRKLAFRKESDQLKVCTIHSFKGWELPRVYVYYKPQGETQFENRVSLLYTAITRAKEELIILNAEETLRPFGRHAAAESLLTLGSESS